MVFPELINLPSKLRFFARKELDETKEEFVKKKNKKINSSQNSLPQVLLKKTY